MKSTTYKQLTQQQRALIDVAEEALDRAYRPYSHFSVGAALLSTDGRIISGANFENAAYSMAICAERSALARANAMGVRTFKGIAVIARGDSFNTDNPTAPCGACRQMLFEAAQLGGNDIEVILSNTNKTKVVATTVFELLPLGFGPADLGQTTKNL